MQAILRAAQSALSRHDYFRIVLAGGTTPRRVYELLREQNTDWSAWHVYFSDERCLPPDHAERNSRMAAQTWLDHAPISPDQIHIILETAVATPLMLRYTLLRKALSTNGVVSNWVGGRSP